MGKSIVIENGNFKSMRAGVKSDLLPPSLYGLKDLFSADKYTSNVLINALGTNDAKKPDNELGRNYIAPTLNTSGALGGKPILRYVISGSSSTYLRFKTELATDWTITVVYAPTDTSGTRTCCLFSVSNKTEYVRFLAVSEGSAQIQSNSLYEPFSVFPYIAAQKEIITISQDSDGVTIFRNGVKLHELPYLIKTINNFDLGGSDIIEGGGNLFPFLGNLGFLATYNRKMNEEEVQYLHNKLSSYYS